MASTPKPVRRNGGSCTCKDDPEWTAETERLCRYGCCTEFRCPRCHGKLGGWGAVGCKCQGGPRWIRHRGMSAPGRWDYVKDDFVVYRVAVKPSIAKRR